MTQGGARNRSGPPPDPNSARSDRRGLSLTALPAQGYDGPVPEWPLPDASARELALWAWAWTTPQACAWSLPSEAWRVRSVALWCRMSVRCEDRDVSAPVLAQLHRFADQIGMTTAGLREMGWAIAKDELREKAAKKPAAPRSSRDRLKAVSGGGG
jgi:hypothetical protein